MSLVRNTLVQSSLTLGSRILGFVRDILIAAIVGAGPVGDAFVSALLFPNLFRRIFAEGAFAQAFVPAYARTLEAEGPEAALALATPISEIQHHPRLRSLLIQAADSAGDETAAAAWRETDAAARAAEQQLEE